MLLIICYEIERLYYSLLDCVFEISMVLIVVIISSLEEVVIFRLNVYFLKIGKSLDL